MQDWLLFIAPLAVAVYFLAYPDQFTEFMNWFARLIQ